MFVDKLEQRRRPVGYVASFDDRRDVWASQVVVE